LPKTITSLARVLGVPPSRLVREESTSSRSEDLLKEARRIRALSPGVQFETLWHTLNLLELTPSERLARSLIRGKTGAVHR
jgi:hypothetical protein